MIPFDRRLIPARDDLIAEHLADEADGRPTAQPRIAKVVAPIADLRPKPDMQAVCDTQLLYGERVNVYETSGDWAWVQAIEDSYVGYVFANQIKHNDTATATHVVRTLGTNIYRTSSLKTPVCGQLPFAAQVCVTEIHNDYARIGEERWLPQQHLEPLQHRADDWVDVAEMFLGVPYLWGGRSNLGLDCSALIQLARSAAGFRCMRDSDMQAKTEGETLGAEAGLQRGDLIFWRGHVGVMSDPDTLLHANGHHMAVTYEPIAEAIRRIEASDGTPVNRRARPK